MAARRRTPFGHLVFTYRTRLNLTQAELAYRASNLTLATLDQATVSDRTISAIERVVGPNAKWMKPRPSTVRALADVFNLQPGTPDHEEFIEASRAVNPLAASGAGSRRRRQAAIPNPENVPLPPPEPPRDEPRFVSAG
jgi:transcriptional regulator with XRE-family HTH domain